MKLTFKKPLSTAFTMLLMGHASANACDAQKKISEATKTDTRKTELIENLYLNLEDSHGFVYFQATPDFKAMFDRDAQLAEGNGMACLDYDMVVQGQDYNENDIQNSLNVTESNGMVRASFTNLGVPVVLHYKVVCDDYKCAIDDIIDKQGSTKQAINACLDKL